MYAIFVWHCYNHVLTLSVLLKIESESDLKMFDYNSFVGIRKDQTGFYVIAISITE